jgi:hypothetical protein
MLSRGFQGDIPSLKKYHVAAIDLAYLTTIIAFLAVFRFFRVTEGIGRIAQELYR